MSAKIPVLRRLRPETWLDLHCVSHFAVLSTALLNHFLIEYCGAMNAVDFAH